MLGIYQISLSVFMVIATIIASGIAITISRMVSINHSKQQEINNSKLIFSSLILTTALAIILVLLIILCKIPLENLLSSTDSYDILILMIPAIIALGIYTPFKSYLLGREMYAESSIVELIEQILKIVIFIIMLLFASKFSKLYAPVIAMSIAAIISTVIGIIIYFQKGGKVKIAKPSLKPLITKSTPITLVRVLSSLTMPLITIIIPILLMQIGYSNESALSELGVASGMTMPLLSIPATITGALSVALVPQITTLYENKEHTTINYNIEASLKFTIIISALFVPIFASMGQLICQFVFNNNYAGILLAKSCWIMIPLGLNQITTTILNSMGREKSTFAFYIISSIIMVAIVIILTKYIGILSITYAIGVSNIILCIMNIVKIKQLLKSKYGLIRLLIWITIICLAVTVLDIFISNLLSRIVPTVFNLIISCSISCIAFLLLSLAFNLININWFKEQMLKKFSNHKFKKKLIVNK